MSIIKERNTDKIATLLKQDRKIFHLADLGLLWNITNKATLRSTVSRYIRRGVLIKIYRGFYSLIPISRVDLLEMGASALHEYSYVSTETVLVKHGIIFQKLHTFTYCSVENRAIQIGDNLYRSRQLKAKFLYNDFGITKEKGYQTASLERAIADLLYFDPKYHFDYQDAIDWEKVKTVQKEVGYI